ncbi:Ig-like domain-containing protein [Cognatiyoonia sediminum]|uniref:Ig-like domain-containing protein n=1 Tax=Cognatiyoonia sediminum TaxID=1508389 RepID=UPI0010424603|nr:Ig-like domain-containing protein [Cognatiyoonia sediminum]
MRDTATTSIGTSVTIDVLANDHDPLGGSLSIATATADHGSLVVEANNALTYIPDPDFTGSDVITYGVTSTSGGSANGLVDVLVQPTATPLALTIDAQNTFVLEAASSPIEIEVSQPDTFASTTVVDLSLTSSIPFNCVPPKLPNTLAVGSILTPTPGLWLHPANSPTESRRYDWERDGQTIAADQPSYTITPADHEAELRVVETVDFGAGPAAQASPTIQIPAASTGVSGFDDFTGPNQSLLIPRTTLSGDTWTNVVDVSDVLPWIVGDHLELREPEGGVFAIANIDQSDTTVRCDVSFAQSKSAVGVVARVNGSTENGTLSAYYARYYWNRAEVQLYAFTGDGAIQEIISVDHPRPSLGSQHTIDLTCLGDQISVRWSGATVIAITDTTLSSSGSIGIAHYDTGAELDNFYFEEITP